MPPSPENTIDLGFSGIFSDFNLEILVRNGFINLFLYFALKFKKATFLNTRNFL